MAYGLEADPTCAVFACLSFQHYQLCPTLGPQLADYVGIAKLGWHHVSRSERQQLRETHSLSLFLTGRRAERGPCQPETLTHISAYC